MLRVIRKSSLLHYSAGLILVCAALLFVWPGLMRNLFASDRFMTHYHGYAQIGPLVNLHYYSDWLIGLAYIAIFLTLTSLVYRARRDIPFHWVFLAFGLFSIACAGTHFMEVYTTYHAPVYWLAGYVKLITAVASLATAIVLPPLVPKTLALIRNAKLSEQQRAAGAVAPHMRDTHETLQAIIQASPLAIVVLDTEANVKLWNSAAERIYGWRAQEVLGRPLPTVPPEMQADLRRDHATAVAGQSFTNYETRRLRKDGTLIDVSISTAPLRDATGQTNGVVALVADITERKRVEQALSESEDHFRTVAETASDAIITIDETSTMLFVNRRTEKIFGYAVAEMLGASLTMLMPDYLRPLHKAGLDRYLNTGQKHIAWEAVELPGRHKSGRELPLELSFAEFVRNGRRYFTGIVRDITERKHAETGLFQMAAIVESSDDAIISKNMDSTILSWNPAAEQLYGYTAVEAIGQAVTMLIPSAQFDEEPRILEQIKRGQRVDHYETVRIRKDGTLVDVSLTVSPVKDAAGRIVGASNIARDITERKRAETALRQGEARNRALLNAIPDLMFRLGRDGRFLDVHATRPADLLTPPADFIGKQLADVLPPALAANALAHIERAIASGELQIFEYELVAEEGTRSYEARVTASSEDEVIVIVRDVTRRKRGEAAQRYLADATAALASSLDYEQTLQRVAHLAIPHLADWCMVYMVDDADAIRLLAVAHQDETKTELAWQVEREDALTEGGAVPKAIRTGQSELYPHLPTPQPDTPTHGVRRLELARQMGLRSVMIVPLVARGRTLGALSFATAESGRTYGPADLALAEELARRAALAIDNARLYQRAQEANRAKDEFLATLSHELRTPLTPIIGWIHMLGTGQTDAADVRHGLGVIDKNSQALARLINDLLDMSAILNGKMRVDRLPVTIEHVLREACETVRLEAARRGIEIELANCPTAELIVVAGDRTRLGQVCWNLINNAAKFSNDGGRVRVRCEADEKEVRIHVEDEGVGITPEFLPHVFERFRQADMSATKRHGGLGIGLALVKSFVEAHGGTVHAESAGEGQGSRFTVRLPRMALNMPAATSAATHTAAPPSAGPRARRHMLIVEDAEDTLELLRRAFERRGYRVTACASADEALSIAERERFDIIISDIGLPHIDGYELLERLRRAHARLRAVPAVALTGYAAAQDVTHARAAGFAAHVAKPVDPVTLARVIEQLLASSAQEDQA